METTRIQNSQTEQIRVTALDIEAAYITGLTDVLLEIRRESDGYYLDFNDSTFKNSGWTTRQEQMAELDVTNSPGTYFYNFDTTGFSDDNYYIRVTSATAYNTPWEGELKVGDYVDNLDATVSSRASEANATSNTSSIISEVDANETKIDLVQSDVTDILADTNETQGKLPTNNIMGSSVKTDKDDEIDAIKAKTDNLPSDPTSEINATSNKNEVIVEIDANEVKIDLIATDLTAHRTAVEDRIIRILGLSKENIRLFDPIYDSNSRLLSCTFKTYSSKADTISNTNAISTYSIVGTYNDGSELLTWREVKE